MNNSAKRLDHADEVQGISMANENLRRGSGAQITPAQAQQPSKSFAEIAIERGYCTAEQIDAARQHQRQLGPKSNVELAQVLVDLGTLTQQQARACERATRGAQVIAGFEILEKVGQGGMGAVFRARQMSMDRIVALKILPPKLAQDPSFKTRFLNEAKVCAKLSHMNIINGIDCGEAGGYTYFAMEFVDGRTIKQIMKEKGKFSPADALKIIRQMVDALAYAKSMGLVHRDVKPDNIMMTAGGVAKLCDLGLAKHVEGNDDASLTQSGQAVGTPHYIAPEQARGEAVDFNTDIYSLGATFYHMLTSKTPFDAPTSAAVMALHIANDTKSPCDVDPSVPIGYGQVISRMMAKFKEDRYNNPADLVKDLDALEEGRTPAAASFKAKTSCLMPQSSPNRGLRGRTTGPQSPVTGRTTGPQTPVGGGGDSPHATGTRNRPARKEGTPWVAIGGFAIVVLVALMFAFGKQPPEKEVKLPEPPKVVKNNDTPAIPTPPVEKKPEPPPFVDPKIVSGPPPRMGDEPKIKEPDHPKEVVKAPEPAKVDAPKIDPPVAVAVKKPDPEPTPPVEAKFTLNNKIIHARFFAEMLKKTAKADLAKAAPKEIHDLAENPAYKSIHKETQAELDSLEVALKFEQEAMKAMAANGTEIVLTDERATQLGVSGKVNHLKAVEYKPDYGLSVQIPNGPIMPVKGIDIAGDQIVKSSPDAPVASRAIYTMIRGNKDAFKAMLETIPPKERPLYEAKLALWNEGDREWAARAEIDKLEKLTLSKDFKIFESVVADFEKNYGSTPMAQEFALKIAEWKAVAANTLRPPNPWKNYFHAPVNRLREDGFLELTYDFSSPDQALDFVTTRGEPKILDGHLFVAGADDRGDRLAFAAPISDLRGILISYKTQHARDNTGFRLGGVPEGAPIGGKMGVLLGLDWDSAFLYTSPSNHLDTAASELNFGDIAELEAKSTDGRSFSWTCNGKPLGSAPVPDNLHNARLAMNYFNGGHNIWRKFKIIFRPEPGLLNK